MIRSYILARREFSTLLKNLTKTIIFDEGQIQLSYLNKSIYIFVLTLHSKYLFQVNFSCMIKLIRKSKILIALNEHIIKKYFYSLSNVLT